MQYDEEVNLLEQKKKFYWNRVREYSKPYDHFHWPSMELLLNLNYTQHLWFIQRMNSFSEFGLSLSAMNILMILKFGEAKGCNQQELSMLLSVSRANITKIIDGMEKRGLVLRSASDKDRRERLIQLTEKGKTLAERIIPLQNKLVKRSAAGLNNEEINALSRLLAKFSAHMVETGKIK